MRRPSDASTSRTSSAALKRSSRRPRRACSRVVPSSGRSWPHRCCARATPIGVIFIRGPRSSPFTAKQIALLETFADQAVIAIENVRLFKELRSADAELTRSVEQLTALGDVGRALSSTLDLETVLQTIVTRANQLAGDGTAAHLRVRRGAPRSSISARATTWTSARSRISPRGADADPQGEGVDGPRR